MPDMLYEVEGGVARLTINRPEQRNALNAEVIDGLRQGLWDATADRQVRVVTLTGAGDKAFCAGADLKGLAAPGQAPFAPGDYRQLLLALHRCPKPTVALARGHVVAGGMGLFLACDLALACDDIQLSTPEIHVGMFPMMVLAFLQQHVGRKRALELAFLGEPLTAAAAQAIGLVNQLVPRAAFEAAASEFVGKIAAKSTFILRLGKEALQEVEDLTLPAALERLQASLEKVMASADSKEGIRAFAEKRQPRWTDS